MKTSSQRKTTTPRMQFFLRIKHPSIDTAEITRTMGIEPEHAVNAGRSLSAAGKQTLHSESYWIAPLQVPGFPVSKEMLLDYQQPLSASSVTDKLSLHYRLFDRDAFPFHGLSKEDIVQLIGAPPLELMIVPWLQKNCHAT